MSDYRSICRSLTAFFSHRPNKRKRKRGKLRPEGFSAHFAGLQDSRLTRVLHACESLEMRAMLSAMPIVASAESDFIFSNGVITGYIGTGGDVVIPASIGGVAVTAIGNSAFSQNSVLTAVTLPSGLISIGHDAFSGCPGLLAVTIPASVTSIASAAFGSCSNLAGITVLPGNQAFSSEHGLLMSADGKTLVKCPAGKTGDLVVPSHVTTIGDHAFVGCASLSTVAIPSSVSSVGNWAFERCTGLVAITIPSSVTGIGWRAFIGCEKLADITVVPGSAAYSSRDGFLLSADGTTLVACPAGKAGVVVVPAGVTSIGSSSFFSCKSLTSIAFPDSVTRIDGWAFYDCTGLTVLAIPSNVTAIGNDAFGWCTGVSTLTIPSSVTSIGDRAFYCCFSLKSITVMPGNTAYSSRDGFLLNADGTTLVVCPPGRTGVVVVPMGVTRIENAAFVSCDAVSTIAFPATVTDIGSQACAGCHGLSRIYFAGDAPVSVGADAFNEVSGIVYYTAGTKGWTNPFYGLATANVTYETGDFKWALISNGGVTITGYNGIGGDIVVPASIDGLPVTEIGYLAFYNRAVTAARLPSTIVKIADFAFYRCPLTYANVPAGVRSIGKEAFARCSPLTSIDVEADNPSYSAHDGMLFTKDMGTLLQCPAGKPDAVDLPDNVTEIAPFAFEGCSKITTVHLPARIARIGEGAFSACYGLLTLTADSGNEHYSSIDGVLFDKAASTLLQYPAGKSGEVVIPASVVNIGTQAFAGCFRLTTATIPFGVQRIEAGAFFECSNLSTIQLPTSLIAIGAQVFDGCGSLMGIDIPQGVVEIGQGAFNWCGSLGYATIPASVTSMGAYIFHGCTSLTLVSVDEANPIFAMNDGLLLSKDGTQLIKCPGGRVGIVNVPAGVTSVDGNAFFLCGKVTVITLPSSVTAVGGRAFDGCSQLAGVSLSPSMEIICEGLFNNCVRLTEIVIPKRIKEIWEGAFSGCSKLARLYFEGDPPVLRQNNVFDRIDSGATAYFNAGTQGWDSQLGGIPTTQVTLPLSPGSLSVLRGNASAALSWTVPPLNGVASISDYVIQYRRTTTQAWSTFQHVSSAATTAVVTGLANRQAYVFRVAAVNALGQGNWSTQSGVIVPLPTPSAPGRPGAVAGNGVVSLRFAAPRATGGLRVTDYVIQYSANSGASWTTAADSVSPLTTATVRGLSNGTPYLFRVAAVTAGGTGAFSVSSAQVIPYLRTALPAAPTSVTGRGSGGMVSLSWASSSSNAGGPIRDYVVQFRTAVPGSRWFTYTDDVTSANAATVRRLVAGRSYIFRVAAKNLAGQGTFSSPSAVIRA
jgi:hypothetical protein